MVLFVGCYKDSNEFSPEKLNQTGEKSLVDTQETVGQKGDNLLSDCCDSFNAWIFNSGAAGADCFYDFQATNGFGECDIRVIQDGNVVATIPANTSTVVFTLLVNSNSPLPSFVQFIADDGTVCKQLALSPNCDTACCETGDVTVDNIQSHGRIGETCCRYTVTITNNSTCVQHVFDENGVQIATIQAGSFGQVSICIPVGINSLPGTLPSRFKVGPNLSEICTNFELSAYCKVVG